MLYCVSLLVHGLSLGSSFQMAQHAQLAQPRAPAVVSQMIGTVPDNELEKPYDVVVIGGGPAGVAGALKAATLGRRALIGTARDVSNHGTERIATCHRRRCCGRLRVASAACSPVDKPKAAPPGGGLDWGFGGPTGLFSKALRDCSKSLDIESLAAQGLDNDVIWLQIQNMCVRLATNNAESRLQELERFRVSYLQGEATLLPQEGGEGHRLLVKPVAGTNDEVTISTDNVLVCTGSFPTRMGNIPFDGSRIFDADSINGLGFLPKSVAVVGSGIIAIEYAKIFRKVRARTGSARAVRAVV